MKTTTRTVISILLLLCLLASPVIQLLNVKADSNTSGTAVSSVLNATPVPLTFSEIVSAWPNLPSAQEVYNAGDCSIVDVNSFGKSVPTNTTTGLPTTDGIDPNSPALLSVNSEVSNCTSTVLNIQLGEFIYNVPFVWLQYNTTIWVQVPYSDLQTTVEPYAAAINQLNGISTQSASSPMTSTPTWSVGEYDNPQAISGSYSIMGAVSYGEWTSNKFGSQSSDYLGVDVLSVYTQDNYWIQAVMMLTPSGMSLYYNIWTYSNGKVTSTMYPPDPITPPGGSSQYTLYSLFIQYSSSYWQLFWNQNNFYQFKPSSSDSVVGGTQSNAVVETNDFTQSDFTGSGNFQTTLGGLYYSSGYYYCLPAVGFLFNGNWHPVNEGDTAPAAYDYLGGNILSGWASGPGGTGQDPPPNWGSYTVGLTPNEIEEFNVGVADAPAGEGQLIWSQGPVP